MRRVHHAGYLVDGMSKIETKTKNLISRIIKSSNFDWNVDSKRKFRNKVLFGVNVLTNTSRNDV